MATGIGLIGGLPAVTFPVLVFTGVLAGMCMVNFMPSLAYAFPHRDTTVGDLARHVLAVNHGRLAVAVGSWNKQDLWNAFQRIISEQVGVSPEDVRPEASFIDDLRID